MYTHVRTYCKHIRNIIFRILTANAHASGAAPRDMQKYIFSQESARLNCAMRQTRSISLLPCASTLSNSFLHAVGGKPMLAQGMPSRHEPMCLPDRMPATRWSHSVVFYKLDCHSKSTDGHGNKPKTSAYVHAYVRTYVRT